mmetsp:Transcript_8204/g.24144  ORF Transcript_8204/g.24144 Transcript_8204/m.24144 type:complete len:264 (-) Transcript_8204:1491-2282(-)
MLEHLHEVLFQIAVLRIAPASVRHLGGLDVVLDLLTFLRLHECHEHHEACQVDKLFLGNDPIPLDVKDVDKVSAMLLGQGVVVHLGEVDDDGNKLLGFQHTALVPVKIGKVFLTVFDKLVAAELGQHLLRQEGQDILHRVKAILQTLQQPLDALLAEEHLLHVQVLVSLGKAKEADQDDVSCEGDEFAPCDHAIVVLVKYCCKLLALLIVHPVRVHLAELAQHGEDLLDLQHTVVILVEIRETFHEHLLEVWAGKLTNHSLRY